MSENTSRQSISEMSQERKLDRHLFLEQLGLLTPDHNGIFAQATQSVAFFLNVPICTVDILVGEDFFILSSFGLFNVGLMNNLTKERKIPKANSLSFEVMTTEQVLMIENITQDSPFAQHILTEEYGITAYLGVPLFTPQGLCLGSLNVMDLKPRTFTDRDLYFLKMTARWCVMEYLYQKQESDFNNLFFSPQGKETSVSFREESPEFIEEIKHQLLAYFTQELKMPVTSIMGMASVLKQEVYGKVTEKQKKYLEVIHDSSQYLISLVDEVIKLGEKKYYKEISLSNFDVEMLCQQVVNNIEQIAHHYKQKIKLTIEPGKRLWSLDKEKIQASLFYLILTVLESAEPEGEIRLHFSRKKHSLNFSVWSSHPWLDDSFPSSSIHYNVLQHCLKLAPNYQQLNRGISGNNDLGQTHCFVSTNNLQSLLISLEKNKQYRQLLELFLSCYWIESHKGKLLIQGFSDLGYRYILTLPKVED